MTITEVELAKISNSRFKVLDSPVEQPGSCGVCGSTRSDDRKYVEFGLRVLFPTGDPYAPRGAGRLYFCTYCLTEAAELIGLVTHSEGADFDKIKAETLAALENAKSFIEGDLIDSYRNLLELHVSAVHTLLSNFSSVAIERSEGREQTADAGVEQSVEPVSSERPDDVPSVTNDGDPFTF